MPILKRFLSSLAAVLACASALAGVCSADTAEGRPDVGSPPAILSPAEVQIGTAERRRDPIQLAIGLTRRARETGDPAYYDRALEALDDVLRSDSHNPDALRVSAWVHMGRHEFAAARRIARRHLAGHPEDAVAWGILGDADMELGRYEEAGAALQAMNDRRPGPAAYSRAAYHSELRGDLQGALELMEMSLAATGPFEVEDRAWLLVQIGHLRDLQGDIGAAEATYRSALGSFPGYHYALAALAEICLRTGRDAEAAEGAQRAIDAAPHAERYLLLADALQALGRERDAAAAEDRFESLALENTGRADNENHDLVLFYLERRPDPGRALAIARREAARRRDVHTLDRLAWALFNNGRQRAAARLMTAILQTGTRDPLIAQHAAAIRAARLRSSG
ncbi:MAG TPA: tetratricopeptide repeat protein [Candidatus Polarisedimenticolia bacterium]|nr:tetratricopeptide repeat protein [Candidatus Polarisedimenticolia bacterium]